MDDMAWGRVHSAFDVVLAARKNGTPIAMKNYAAGWEGSLPRSHLERGIEKGCAEALPTPRRKKPLTGEPDTQTDEGEE